jgi:hypothetical protein
MSSVSELLDRLAEIGATIRPAGDHLILRAGSKPVPAALVKRLHRAKAEVLDIARGALLGSAVYRAHLRVGCR